ncbi:MAG: WGR and DUF4132 domain-containing protein [Planctomycetia bacterium]|nr:WGR and DUF4132 domain-containing protein [Planctomycetia bacterium]
MSRREFQFSEGKSHKFWTIELSGKSHTVNFGKIGTTGQTQTKDFTSEDEAKKSYEKLIAEKVKKGYVEQTKTPVDPVSTTKPTAEPVSTPTAMEPTKKKGKAEKTEPVSEAAVEPPASAPEPPAATLTQQAPTPIVTHTIELAPEDYAWATWRKRQTLKKPEPKPFNFEECRKRLSKIKKSSYGWVNWSEANLEPSLTAQEAHFWFLAMTDNLEKLTPAEIADKMKEKDITGKVEVEDAIKRMKSCTRFQPAMAIRALFNLFDGPDAVELLQNETVMGTHWEAGTIALSEFTRYVFPYLDANELKGLTDSLRPLIDPKDWPTDYYKRPPMAFFIAALIGMPDEIFAVVRAIPDKHYSASGWDHSYYHQTQRIVFGLGSPQLIESEMRRLKLALHTPEFMRAWLALTEFAGLDYACENILAEARKDDRARLIREFARVKAPEAAPHMMELKINSKAPSEARKWLDENTGNAIAGLLSTVAGRGKVADGAAEFLREAKKKGHEGFIRECLKTAKPEVAEAVRKNVLDVVEKEYPLLDDKTTPAKLKTAFETAAKAKKSKLPGWIDLSSLPKILVNEHRLSDAQATAVLEALQRSTPSKPDPLVVAVKAEASADSLDAFAWKLFQLWQGEETPSKEKWAMGSIGLFGGDGSALKITPLIRNWPGESQHQRAVFGLECLRAIGSDLALMQLNGISQKLKFKGLKQKATEAMEAIAKEKGLTRAQLEDRVVPDCDLDERGNRIFDFGPRQFRFVLGPEMKPMIKDADGKVKTDLPKPGTKDDAPKANEAVAAWKLMKKQIKEVAKIQAHRLEQAMVTGRRWPIDDFQTLLVKHPLMINLVRLVLWGGYDKSGRLSATFRVTEDQSFADPNDGEFKLKELDTVGIVHPLHLSDEQKSAWGEIFSDYEIVPPFPQLGRSIFRLEKDEENALELTRFAGVTLPAPSLVFGLENLGWVRGYGGDGGSFHEHSKPFPGCNVTAVVNYEGSVGFGYIDPNETITFENCYFVDHIRGPATYAYNEKRTELGQVDPVALSEVINDLSTLAAKAK